MEMIIGTQLFPKFLAGTLSGVHGGGFISGRVSNAGAPVKNAAVLLICERGVAVGYMQANEDGVYQFNYINMSLKYTVIAFDAASKWNAVVSDNISPVLMQ